MIVYKLTPDPGYPGIKYKDINQWFDTYRDLESSPRRVARKWVPPKCRKYTMEDFHDASCRSKQQSQKLFDRGTADFAIGVPAFSKRAVKSLAPLMKKFGEFLPLDVEGQTGDYFHYHCTKLLDALDLNQCGPLLSDGKITAFKMLVFDRSKMADAKLFRLAVLPTSCRVYVTDEFVSRMPPDLTGFIFDEVWRD